MANCVDLQGYLQCTKKLYAFGYRIGGPKSEDEKKNTPGEEDLDGAKDAEEGGSLLLDEEKRIGDVLPGEKEKICEKHVIQAPYPDQVRFHEGYFLKMI